MWIRDAARDEKLPEIGKLNDPRYFPYRWGQAFWSYVGGRWGDEAVGRLLKRAGGSGDLASAFVRTLGIPDSTLSADWHDAIRAAYDPVAATTKGPETYGEAVFSRDEKEKTGGHYNLAPALSPDGKQMVFISERDQFSIELFLADVASKSITRKIVKTAVDPHFESLQFINSSGAWSADGQRFVLAGVRKGKPVLSIIKVENGDIDREIALPDLGEAFNPTWSPDGRYVAFSAIAGGLMDLYIYDLNENLLKRMTNDAYAEIEPSWSPDGKTIAFVTDRFSTDLPRLRHGNYRLAALDPASGAVRPLPSFSDGKNINPQWSSDGKDLYFLSDHTGITNIYRVDLAAGTIFQITNLYTGVSGITDLSPALSSAARANHVAFSVYKKGSYGIYSIENPTVLAGEAPRGDFPQGNPGILPPPNRDREGVIAMLQDPATGLPPTTNFGGDKYRAGLSLDYIGQPSLAVGVDSWGAFVGGGASAFWSDMLGNHNLATVLQMNGTLKDITVGVGYTNLARRLNWGVVAQQVPLLSGGIAQAVGTVDGQDAYFEQLIRYRQTSREVGFVTSYAISRVRRVEGSVGFSNITFDTDIRTKAWELFGNFIGNQLMDSTITASTCGAGESFRLNFCSPADMNLGTASLATVYDNSLFGATSPILGARYRLEADPTVGSLNMLDLLGDYRKYFMPVRPFTFATRLVYRGRHGPDADTDRLYPLYLGYQTIIRGYGQNSWDIAAECGIDVTRVGTGTVSCPSFDRLLGSKMLFGNAELRFPLLGVLGIGSGYYGGFPIEMAFFGDAGVAWTNQDNAHKAWFLGGVRKPIYSAGVALRINLLGFAILEIDAAHPFNRAGSGLVWQFGLSPGF
ncbi:MAG: PD40 domain-containing protein [Gemmatimonadetes bacterium]|nr:PD40 domain-containing protein [Gemmatimonadota bacterium]